MGRMWGRPQGELQLVEAVEAAEAWAWDLASALALALGQASASGPASTLAPIWDLALPRYPRVGVGARGADLGRH